MKDIVERFLSYTAIDTTSQEGSGNCPSNPNEFILAQQLADELKELGVDNVHVDEHAFVYGTIAANSEKPCDTVGFLAHMDTSNAASGENVHARIINNYQGNDIELSDGIVTSTAEYPSLLKYVGKDLIVTDGKTLLGGDDKAGIAIIMDLVQFIHQHPEFEHGEIRICFTPDEEIGMGIDNINLADFACDYAFTIDGGEVNDVTYETFSAATAIVKFNGNSIHPGSAKNKMINALQLAIDFHQQLPVFERPEFTEGYEGFNHLLSLEGECEKARSIYIIRNHDNKLLEKQKREFELISQHMNDMYGKQVVELTIKDTYRNMKDAFADKMHIVELAMKAIEQLGYQPTNTPVRGGTDGCKLTYMGIPTPNLGTGDMFMHGNHEIVCINDMKEMVQVLKNLVTNILERGK